MTAAYSPRDPTYWDPVDLEAETRRVFDICHGCRLCFNLCPSFPDLFGRIDANDDEGLGEVESLGAADFRSVVDLCYQCKLCYLKCPYTPPHEWALDFPRLMLRSRAQRARREGVTLQDKILGEPEWMGRLGGGAFSPLSNLTRRLRPAREVLHRTAGIHRDARLPAFAKEPFSAWFEKHAPSAAAGQKGRVALFTTCSYEYNAPKVARATVEVLERNGLAVELPRQRCCGMPNLDGGDVAAATEKAHANVEALLPAVRRGLDVVVPGPTCSYVLTHDYPLLLGTPEADEVAKKTFDLAEYLMRLHGKGALDTRFSGTGGRIAYHAPCHLRAQQKGLPASDLLKLVPGTEVTVVAECSGVDGTWGMKSQYYDLSMKVAQKLFSGIESAAADRVATDCPLAALRIAQGTGMEPLHPVEILREAYGP